MTTSETTHQEMRTAALTAGIGLLVMAVLAGLANFGIIERLVTDDDSALTVRDLLASEGLFRIGVAGLVLVIILDVVVAYALMVFFTPVQRGLAALAALFRLLFAGVFLVAIGHLVQALRLLPDAGSPRASDPGQRQAEVMLQITAFHDLWEVALMLFGIHLLLLGYLAHASGFVPKLLGPLLGIAGLGYLVDGFVTILAPGTVPSIAAFTFIGEVFLMLWLLLRGRNITPTRTAEGIEPLEAGHAGPVPRAPTPGPTPAATPRETTTAGTA